MHTYGGQPGLDTSSREAFWLSYQNLLTDDSLNDDERMLLRVTFPSVLAHYGVLSKNDSNYFNLTDCFKKAVDGRKVTELLELGEYCFHLSVNEMAKEDGIPHADIAPPLSYVDPITCESIQK
jgi:hypothetical protein